ncbi:MAG: hypothetical protein FWC55_02895 [Firmicutes bacterium]|nr:hypothetical protein [Bacillota bacterium]
MKLWLKGMVALLLLAAIMISGCKSNNSGGGANPTATPAPATKAPATEAPATEAPATEAPATEAPATQDNAQAGAFDVSKASELHITMLSKIGTGSKQPANDLLTPIWREKTKVIPEIVQMPGGMSGAQYFQMQKIGGTMPEIIGQSNGIFDNPEAYQSLRDLELLRPITLDEIKTYMPLTVARLTKWGVNVDDWYSANLDAATQKLWFVPSAPPRDATNLVNEPYVQRNISWSPYSWYFRDDILKMIFPQAKSEKELIDLYISKGGNLSFEDINDVPIYTLDDFYIYLKKVKELNLKVGTNNVTPGQIQLNSAADSMMWSAFTLPGFFWQDLGDRLYDVNNNKFAYFADTPEWKNYIQWFNKLYNEDLIGKETFIQKDEQRDAKVVNGEYAVFQGWLDANSARKVARDENRGYGFRQVYLFMPESLQNKYQDNSVHVASLSNSWGAVGITTSVKEADIPQILNWIDWNYSEEASTLRAWGPPDFYTGDGYDRRFKPEYQDVANWAVSGTSSEKDGIYYGMYPVNGSDVDWNSETYGIGFDSFKNDYPPQECYPPDLTNPDSINSGGITDRAIRMHYAPMIKTYTAKPLGDDVIQAKIKFDALEKQFADLKKTTSFDCDGAKTQTITAIVGKPEDFEANYKEYEDRYLTPEFRQNVKDMGDAWLAYKQLYMQKYTVPLK